MKERTFNPETLRYLRRMAGLTQAEVASQCDVSRETISRIELYIHRPSKITVKSLALVFGVVEGDFYLSNYEFAQKHNFIHPAWIGSLFNKLIMRIHLILDYGITYEDGLCKTTLSSHELCQTTLAAATAINKIQDKLDLLETMHKSEPSQAQIDDLDALANAEKEDDDLVKDKDADPRA